MTVPQRVVDRILTRVQRDEDTECWIWPGATTGPGYGHISWNENGVPIHTSTHRALYVATVGQIPAGRDLDHLCRNRLCCNPQHLEPVTRRENLLRGRTVTAARAAVTHCPQGHEYTAGNTFVDKKRRRHCRECGRIQNRAYMARRRAIRHQERRTATPGG